MKFIFNDCGVCTNPEIIYSSEGKYSLAWLYYELKICSGSGGLWDFGYNYGGGGSPATKNGKYTREEAIKKGLEFLKNKAQKSIDSEIDVNNTRALVKASKHFLKYYEELKAPKQLSLF